MTKIASDSSIAAAFLASPNHGERARGAKIDSIILHYTGLRDEACDAWTADPGGEALRWLCNPDAQVSCHYLVCEDGRVVQLVAEERRAWHAGRGTWKDCSDLNSCSIGIEIVNTGHAGGLPPYPEVQIKAVIALCRDIMMRNSIAPERILAHSDIAPDRKADPGEHFPWDELCKAGVGLCIEPAPLREGVAYMPGDAGEGVRVLQQKLATIGYGPEISSQYDIATQRIVRAFQRRYRPACVDGLADASTCETIDKLLAVLAAR